MVSYSLFAFADVRLLFCFNAWAFAFVLLSAVVVCTSCLPFAFVCLFSCASALVCSVCCLAMRPQSYLLGFHAGAR